MVSPGSLVSYLSEKRLGGSWTLGVSEDGVAKLCEPFYTTKPRGTGLGLTVVSRVLEQNGGRVGVRSSRGEGTMFSLVLPVAGGE